MARVLLVDDDRAFSRSLQILLEDEGGHEVTLAHSVGEALAVLEGGDGRLDLVITEHQLGAESGYAVLEALRHRSDHVQVVFMSAHHASLIGAEVCRHGAHAFLAKPMDPQELLDLIQHDRRIGRRMSRES